MAEHQEQQSIFDDVFRTILESFPELMVPLINEVFGKAFDQDSAIVQFKNEHYFLNRKVVTDSHIYVGSLSIENNHYHLECQSIKDDIITWRMVEYDLYIAMEGMRQTDEGIFRLDLPYSAVINLRETHNSVDRTKVKIYNKDGRHIDHLITVVAVQAYSIEEIIEKKLFVLFPFLILRFEKDFSVLQYNPDRREAFFASYQDTLDYMIKAAYPFKQSVSACQFLLELTERVNLYVLRHYPILAERMTVLMGGNLLRTRTMDIFMEGKAVGKAEGRAEGVAEERKLLITRLAESLRKETPALSLEMAVKKAEELLQITVTG